MKAPESSRVEWLNNSFWERLALLEARHQRLQADHEVARRTLQTAGGSGLSELQEAWDRYCAVIADLDSTTAELEVLRNGA